MNRRSPASWGSELRPSKSIDIASLGEPGSTARRLAEGLDLARLPRHIAVIMDGNGRWARQRDRQRVEGHRAGVAAVRETVETCARLGIEVLSLYAFSTENWSRPKHEVWTLMNLLREYMRRELPSLKKQGVRLRVIGRKDRLDPSLLAELEKACDATADGEGLSLNVALDYSGRSEIVDACRRIVQDWASGEPREIDEETLGEYLYTAGQPDPDLLIRTSGELRISNFLLWQLAYTEIWITKTLWPDFDRCDLLRAVLDYQGRNRRFGGLNGEPGPVQAEEPSA